MNFEKYIEYSTDDFVLDSDFMRWVQHPDIKSDLFWNEFLNRYPEKRQSIEEAIFLINAFKICEPAVPDRKDIRLFVKHSKAGTIRKIGMKWLKYAAVFVLLITIGGGIFYYYQLHYKNKFPFEMADESNLTKGRIVLPDGTVNEFETKETQIHQTASGEITINRDTLRVRNQNADKSDLAQVITPYGKRTRITLSDGTKIWLNAGSILSYPMHFSGDSREVYLSGEAFFEVAKDKAKPFYVITNDLKIKVTGTRFNVTSYKNDSFTQAVLLEVKIFASKNALFSKEIELVPGERVVLDKGDRHLQKQKVNVEQYASWVEGYLIINDEPINEITKKLERYYDQKIVIERSSQNMRFTGKLNLADDLSKVLQNIAFSAAFTIEHKNDTYIIK